LALLGIVVMSDCKHENKKINTCMVLLSMPPRYEWKCPDCDRMGYVLCGEANQEEIDFLRKENKKLKEELGQKSVMPYFRVCHTEVCMNMGLRTDDKICRLCKKVTAEYNKEK